MADLEPMRIARFLAAAGIDSRRNCEKRIMEGRVAVNGKILETPAVKVDPTRDEVTFDGKIVRISTVVYLALNKPVGYTCSAHDDHAEHLVYELVPESLGRLFSVGRLDRDSEGLLLLTNDGDFAQRLTHPSHKISKVYHVDVNGRLNSETLEQLRNGIHDNGEFLQPKKVSILHSTPDGMELEFVLTEGKKREVRRLCHSAHLYVNRLVRLRVGNLKLGNLASGEWRELSQEEVDDLLGKSRKKKRGR